MSCSTTRETLIDLGLDAAGRERVSAAMAHAATCDGCRAALADFDLLADVLRREGGEEPADAAGAVQPGEQGPGDASSPASFARCLG